MSSLTVLFDVSSTNRGIELLLSPFLTRKRKKEEKNLPRGSLFTSFIVLHRPPQHARREKLFVQGGGGKSTPLFFPGKKSTTFSSSCVSKTFSQKDICSREIHLPLPKLNGILDGCLFFFFLFLLCTFHFPPSPPPMNEWPLPSSPPHPTTNGGMQNGSSVYTLHTRFCRFDADLHAQSVIIDKISASELSRKFIKSALLVGHHHCPPRSPMQMYTHTRTHARGMRMLLLCLCVFSA